MNDSTDDTLKRAIGTASGLLEKQKKIVGQTNQNKQNKTSKTKTKQGKNKQTKQTKRSRPDSRAHE